MSAIVRYNIVAKSLKDTFHLLAYSLKYIQGKKISIGPFDDRLLSRLYIWIRGNRDEVNQVLEDLKETKIEFVAVPYKTRER
jgi:hypothetical protein